MTTCPSGVDYRRLVDHARARSRRPTARPLLDRLLRAALALRCCPRAALFRAALRLAALARPFAPLLARPAGRRAAARRDAGAGAARAARARRREAPGEFAPRAAPAAPARRAAHRLRAGRARAADQRGDDPAPQPRRRRRRRCRRARAAAARCRITWAARSGRWRRRAPISTPGRARSRATAWRRSSSPPRAAARRSRTTATCSPTIPPTPRRPRASRRSPGTSSEYRRRARSRLRRAAPLAVAYHAACSLQHGQKIVEPPKALLRRAGFDVRTPAEAHLCCGSAGTYNILQPEIAGRCATRKVANIARVKPDVIAAGNIGCLAQIGSGTRDADRAYRRAARLGERRPAPGDSASARARFCGRGR